MTITERTVSAVPRPRKCRKVCRLPAKNLFEPEGGAKEAVVLSVDEYETIRLIDMEEFSQEECAGYMQVARTTVQSIYNSARKKLATALVRGISISISGGDYILCDGGEDECGCGGCRRHRKEGCGKI